AHRCTSLLTATDLTAASASIQGGAAADGLGRPPPPLRGLQDCEVLLHLPVGELDAVFVPLLPLQLDVAVEDVRAERLAHQLRARELVDRLAERLRERDDATLAALLGGEVVEV